MPFGTKADATPSNAASGAGGAITGSGPGKEQRVTKQRVAVSAALDELG